MDPPNSLPDKFPACVLPAAQRSDGQYTRNQHHHGKYGTSYRSGRYGLRLVLRGQRVSGCTQYSVHPGAKGRRPVRNARFQRGDYHYHKGASANPLSTSWTNQALMPFRSYGTNSKIIIVFTVRNACTVSRHEYPFLQTGAWVSRNRT